MGLWLMLLRQRYAKQMAVGWFLGEPFFLKARKVNPTGQQGGKQ